MVRIRGIRHSWNSEEEEIASGWGPSGEVTKD